MWKHEKIENCDKYAEEHNISISSNPDPSKSKSKCIYFTWWRDRKPGEVVLNHQKLPWVSQVDHLGHIIHESGSQDIDCKKARGAYIGSSSELLRNFHSPLQKLSAVKLIVVPFKEAIFGTFTVNMPVKPNDLGTLQLKFVGTCHSLHILILRRIFLKNSTL